MVVDFLSGITEAKREGQKARIALVGPSGSGKTMTSLILAHQLTEGGKVLVIDTENKSSGLFADQIAPGWKYDNFGWDAEVEPTGYDPRLLTERLRLAHEIYDCIIIDSLSAFWNDEGGLLQLVEQFGKGNNMAGWRHATPIQDRMTNQILRSHCHIICNMRAKTEYIIEQEKGKRSTVRALGLKAVQKDDVIYDMTISGRIDLDTHKLSIEKTRFSEIADQSFATDQTKQLGVKIRDWLNSAEAEQATIDMEVHVAAVEDVPETSTIDSTEAEALKELFDSVLDDDKRSDIKQAFVKEFGMPQDLLQSRLAEARDFVSAAL